MHWWGIWCAVVRKHRGLSISRLTDAPRRPELYLLPESRLDFSGGLIWTFDDHFFNNPLISFPPVILLAKKKGIWFWFLLSAWMQSRQAEREEDQRNYSIQERRKLRECKWGPFPNHRLSNWDVSLSLILVFSIWFSSYYYWSFMSFTANLV